jgi:hypothetical protein
MLYRLVRSSYLKLGGIAPSQDEVPADAYQRGYNETASGHLNGSDSAVRVVLETPPVLRTCQVRSTENCQAKQKNESLQFRPLNESESLSWDQSQTGIEQARRQRCETAASLTSR